MRGLYPTLLIALVLIVWEAAALLINNQFILPTVTSVAAVLLTPGADIMGCGSLISNAAASLTRVTLGFLAGAAVAIPLGVLMGRFRVLLSAVDPLVQILRPIPPIAWIPLALAWFKIGLTSVVFIIFIGAFFPILLNTVDGVRRVPRTWIETAAIFGARELQVLSKVVLPAAAPTIWTGLRIGFGIAWMSVVAAEMLPGASSGLGFLIIYAYNFIQIQYIIAGMIVIGVIGLGIDLVLKAVEDRYFRWQEKAR
jgi:NitT/TauT family transport system permease protein